MIAREMIAEKVFAESVAKDIRNFLPEKYENAEFQVMQMNKNNGVQMVGVQVRLQEENVCPVVYVEPFFNEIRLGEPVEKVMNEIARCMEEAGNVPFLHSGINPMDYDSVKEHLAVMLVNTQANKRMLQEMPHENMEDLLAICYVDFPVESNDGKATMKVKNEHLKMWNVDAKEMFHQARANTQPVNTPILQSMDEMMLSIFNEEGHATNLLNESVEFGLRSHDMLYALTNVEKQYGASMITQPEVLNKLEQLFPEGFYVLPSSVHEVLIVPDNGEMEPKMLGEMVQKLDEFSFMLFDWGDGGQQIGDIDADDRITVKDATEVQKYCASDIEFSELEKSLADVNGDGTVNVIDATEIQKIAINAK